MIKMIGGVVFLEGLESKVRIVKDEWSSHITSEVKEMLTLPWVL